jgi:DNA-binding IclR family transcriptional regulator
VFCAFEEPGRIQRRVAEELAQSRRIGRPRAPHDAAALSAMLEGVRARGYATSLDGGGEGIGAVSAPVFDVTGRLSMAVTVFGRAARVDPRPEGRLAPLVAEAAAKLSAALGYRPG